MDFCILGPLEVLDRGRPVGLGGRKQRALLALLLLHAGKAVSTDRLVDELWGERPPTTAAKLVQGYVAALRKLLPDGVLVTRAPGYLLELNGAAHSLDLHRFETLVAAARDAGPERAVSLLREALALWRGPALGDVSFAGLAASEAAGLDGSRLVALTQRIELELGLGRHADLVGELESLVAEHPFQERLRAQLILALYRSGRQAEALEAYRDAHRALDELGIAPSAELERLEKAVLTHDQSLETPPQPQPLRPSSPALPTGSVTLLGTDVEGSAQTDAAAPAAVELVTRARPVYRRPLVIGTFAGVLAAAIAIAVFAFGGGSGGQSLSQLSANSVGVVDAGSGKLVDDVLDVPTPARAAAGKGAIWVTSPDSQIVSRIDPRSREVKQTIPVGSGPTGVAVGGGDVWVANTLDGTVSRIDPALNRVVDTIRVGQSPTALAFGNGSLWVANLDDQTLTRIDGRSGRKLWTKRVDAAARGIAFGGGSVWLSDGARNRVVRLNPSTREVTQTINVGSGPTAVKYGARSLWVANSLDGTVSQIDPSTNAVMTAIQVGSGPNGIAVSGNDVWVTDETGSSLVRLDAVKGSIAAKVPLGSRPGGVALADGSLFVTAQGSATAHRGGTLTLRSGTPGGPDSIDPARSITPLSWAFLTITNDGLVAFKRVGGGDGTQPVPDLATSLPTSTDGGKTYTFELRPGIRFSNGKVVTPADVRHSIEREFAIEESPGPGFFANIEGAKACAETGQRIGSLRFFIKHRGTTKKNAGKATSAQVNKWKAQLRQLRCDLSRGIVIDRANRTVTFHLTRADPDFLYKLATPAGAVVPTDAPRAESKRPLPATGPYMIASYDPKGRLTLVRNPRFRVWSAAAKPDGYPRELRWTWQSKASKASKANNDAIDAVEHGRADVAFQVVTGSRFGELTTQYASQVHSTPLAATDYWVMNTRTPPFDDVRVRRAVNYALDRNELIRRHGGPLTAQPSCQILPPNFPGYRPYCPYTLHPTPAGTWSAPDLAKARALVRASGTRGAKVTLSACSCIIPVAEIRYVRGVLERLGYRVTLDLVSTYAAFFKQVFSLRQIVFTGWGADYPAASNFFGNAIACGGYGNRGKFCDPALDREVKRATVLQQTNPRAASDLWAKVDRQATDQAPWIVGYTPRQTDLLSKRVGNYQHHPMYNILLDQLWVKPQPPPK